MSKNKKAILDEGYGSGKQVKIELVGTYRTHAIITRFWLETAIWIILSISNVNG